MVCQLSWGRIGLFLLLADFYIRCEQVRPVRIESSLELTTIGGIIKALNTGRLKGQKICREWQIPAGEALEFITRII